MNATEFGTSGEPRESDDGLEDEPEFSENDHPFDPGKIKIHTKHIVIRQLVSRISYNEINLSPNFQRTLGIWGDERKSRLIESLLLRIPIPVFYVASDENDHWLVVDGIQRMSTINSYVACEFGLKKLEYLTKFNGHLFSELPRKMQRRIDESELLMNVIEPGTPDEVMYNIFIGSTPGAYPSMDRKSVMHSIQVEFGNIWNGWPTRLNF